MSPLLRKLKKNEYLFIHTGQHHDYNLSLQFIKELSLPTPNYQFKLKSADPSSQISEIILKFKRVINSSKSSIMCVEGDTNTVLASSIFAIKNKIPIAHVEAGLRSNDWRMPEEHNRITTDHISDFLFAPTLSSMRNLKKEHVHGKIFVTGNTIIDAIEHYLPLSLKKSKISLPQEPFVLATLHRSENVDNKKILQNLVNALTSSSLPIIFPIHPRTKQNMKKFKMFNKLSKNKNIILVPPLGYFDFLKAMKYCKFIITDSGGIQEEATSPSIRKFVIVLRKTTDRPESVKNGFAKVVGTDTKNITMAIKNEEHKSKKLLKKSPYGNGHSAQKIIQILKSLDL